MRWRLPLVQMRDEECPTGVGTSHHRNFMSKWITLSRGQPQMCVLRRLGPTVLNVIVLHTLHRMNCHQSVLNAHWNDIGCPRMHDAKLPLASSGLEILEEQVEKEVGVQPDGAGHQGRVP